MKRTGIVILMAASITFTAGSGTLGDLKPDWSVQEQATPLSPSDTSASTGQVNFSCAYGEDSEFTIDNAVEFESPGLGRVIGKVSSLSVDGSTDELSSNVSGTIDTTLSLINAERIMPPVWLRNEAITPNARYGTGTGQILAPYDIATDNIGNIYVTSSGSSGGVDRYKVIVYAPDGTYLREWGAAGVGSGGFSWPNGIAVNKAAGNSVLVYDGIQHSIIRFTSTGTWTGTFGTSGTGAGQFNSPTGRIATDSAGNIYVATVSPSRIQKFNSAGVYQSQVTISGFTAAPFGITVDAADRVIVSALSSTLSANTPSEVQIYNSSLVLQSSFRYTYPAAPGMVGLGMLAADPDGSSVWAHPVFTNYVVRLDYSGNELERIYSDYPLPTDANDKYAIAVHDDAFTGRTVYLYSQMSTGGGQPDPSSMWYGFSGNFMQAFNYTKPTLREAVEGYIASINPSLVVDWQVSSNPNVLFPGWTGNVWKYLNNLCAAYGMEITLIDGVIVIRDGASRELGIDDVVSGSARLTLDTTATGLSIDIMNYNTSSGSGVIWDAADSGTVFSVASGEVVTETVSSNNYPVRISQPSQTDAVRVLPGQYFVTAQDNLPVIASQWKEYGGSVAVAISETIPGAIDITITGPRAEIPGVPGPYSLAISDGETTRPALSITGSGVFTNPETVNLLTGADSAKTSVQVALAIDNIFIGALEQAYDRGAWACTIASGPTISLSSSVPSTTLESFGDSPGSMSSVKEARYRVQSVSIGNAVTGLVLTPHTTTADIDDIWAGSTTGDFDTFWAGADTIDVKVKPLRKG